MTKMKKSFSFEAFCPELCRQMDSHYVTERSLTVIQEKAANISENLKKN